MMDCAPLPAKSPLCVCGELSGQAQACAAAQNCSICPRAAPAPGRCGSTSLHLDKHAINTIRPFIPYMVVGADLLGLTAPATLQATANPWQHAQFSPAAIPKMLQQWQAAGSQQVSQASAVECSTRPATLSPEVTELLNQLAAKQATMQQILTGGDGNGNGNGSGGSSKSKDASAQDREASVNPLSILREVQTRLTHSSEDLARYFQRLAACRPVMPRSHFGHTGYALLTVLVENAVDQFSPHEARRVLRSMATIQADRYPDSGAVTALLVTVLADTPSATRGENMEILEAMVALKRIPQAQLALSLFLLSNTMAPLACIADMLEEVAKLGRKAMHANLWRQVDTEVAAADPAEPGHVEVRLPVHTCAGGAVSAPHPWPCCGGLQQPDRHLMT